MAEIEPTLAVWQGRASRKSMASQPRVFTRAQCAHTPIVHRHLGFCGAVGYLEKTALGVVVLLVLLEVLGEVHHARRQKRNLHLRGATVRR